METLLLIFLFITTSAHAFSDSDFVKEFGFVANRAKQSCEAINQVGFICSEDCKSILLCMKNGEEWTENLYKDCNEEPKKEGVCNLKTLECDNEDGHCKTTSDSKIVCTGSGLYPDPDDCQRFHACSKDKDTSVAMDCASNAHFDPESKQCVLGIDASTCNKPKTNCSSSTIGTVWPWPGSSTYFYICMGGDQPSIYVCDPGYEYVHNSGCVKASVSTTIAPSVICGTHNGYVADPADCTKYYVCRHNQDPVHMSCRRGYYFNKRLGECRYGDCR